MNDRLLDQQKVPELFERIIHCHNDAEAIKAINGSIDGEAKKYLKDYCLNLTHRIKKDAIDFAHLNQDKDQFSSMSFMDIVDHYQFKVNGEFKNVARVMRQIGFIYSFTDRDWIEEIHFTEEEAAIFFLNAGVKPASKNKNSPREYNSTRLIEILGEAIFLQVSFKFKNISGLSRKKSTKLIGQEISKENFKIAFYKKSNIPEFNSFRALFKSMLNVSNFLFEYQLNNENVNDWILVMREIAKQAKVKTNESYWHSLLDNDSIVFEYEDKNLYNYYNEVFNTA